MKTTIELDSDVEKRLRETMKHTHKSFKEALSDAVRSALPATERAAESKPVAREPFEVKARPLGILPEFRNANFNHLAAELEDEAIIAKIRKQGGA